MIDFEEVYRDYLEDVYRFSLALCRDPVLAEELTQETFFRALEHIGQFRGECTLRVWLLVFRFQTPIPYSQDIRIQEVSRLSTWNIWAGITPAWRSCSG